MAFGRAKPTRYGAPRPITAAATRIQLNKKNEAELLRERLNGPNAEWQREAWEYYDAVGEVKFGFGLVGSVISRVRLVAGAVLSPDAPPTPVADAAGVEGQGDFGEDGQLEGQKPIPPELALKANEYLAQLGLGDGVPAMLRAFALNISVPGECYLVCIDDRWSVKSTEEITVNSAGKIVLRTSAATPTARQKNLSKDTPIGRIWRQHPRFSGDPDSSMKAVRGDCEELLLLSRMIRATTRSRLNAGLLFVPDSLSVSARTPGEEEDEGDPFETELVDSMTQPISDEGSAASVVPLLVRGPADAGDKIKYLEISRQSDQHLVERAERALERILQGIDVPKDIVTGLANVKYSNAIQIDESLYKAHIEPLVLMFCDAITDIYLRPLLRASGDFDDEDINRIVAWYDPSEVVVRPDRANDADVGHDKYILSDDAWRAAHGFGDSDAPDEEEIARRIAIEKSTVPPEIAQALLQALLPTVLGEAAAANRASSPFPPELTQQLDATAAPATPELPAAPALSAVPEPSQPSQPEEATA